MGKQARANCGTAARAVSIRHSGRPARRVHRPKCSPHTAHVSRRERVRDGTQLTSTRNAPCGGLSAVGLQRGSPIHAPRSASEFFLQAVEGPWCTAGAWPGRRGWTAAGGAYAVASGRGIGPRHRVPRHARTGRMALRPAWRRGPHGVEARMALTRAHAQT